MAMTSQDHEGFISVNVEPRGLVNGTDEVEQRNYDTTTVDYRDLNHAALKGDWESATRFIAQDSNAVTARVSIQSMTALHVAARAGQSDFIEKLVAHELMSEEALAIKDSCDRTALHYAAMSASRNAVAAMVNKYPASTQIMDKNGWTPLFCAVSRGTKEVVLYLYSRTTDDPPASPFTGPMAAPLICAVTRSGFYDVAMDLILRYPHLATARDHEGKYVATAKDHEGKYVHSVLRVLAEMPSAFRSGSRLGFLGNLAYKCGDATVRDEVEIPEKNSRDLVERLISTSFRKILFKTMKFFVPACHWKKVDDKIMRLKQAEGLVELVCKEVSKMNYSQIEEFFKESSILTTAASYGIEEIVRLCCLQYFPDLVWLTIDEKPNDEDLVWLTIDEKPNDEKTIDEKTILHATVEHRQNRITIDQKTILHAAVEHRQEGIFKILLKEIAKSELMVSGIVMSGTNILHAVAKLPPLSRLKSIDGSALQMQSELRWFEDVNDIVPPSYKEERNAKNQTALDAFMEAHTDLAKDAETWMKEKSNHCMVVAALVTTVAFTAAFTVPGGINSNGTPIFLRHDSFLLFAVSDALALFFSSTSIIMCLCILASRTTAKDFKLSLFPTLANAIVYLFLAITAMVFAFGSALWIILDGRLRLIPIVISTLCLGPVLVFTLSQLPLISHVFDSHLAVAAMIASGFGVDPPSPKLSMQRLSMH